MRGHKISKQLKFHILKESMLLGSNLLEIAVRHKIKKSTIQKWIREHQLLESPQITNDKFVEVSLSAIEGNPIVDNSSNPILVSAHNLKSVLLKFSDCELSINGSVNSASLISIIRILEAGC